MGPGLRRDDENYSRGMFLPEPCKFVCSSPEERAQGMPGARCTRGLVCQELRIWRTRAYRFSGNTPASPAQWLYGLLRALPGGAGLLSPSPAAKFLQDLAPASRRQDHTTSPYAAEPFAVENAASIASRAQRVVTMAIRPSGGRETVLFIILIFRNCKQHFARRVNLSHLVWQPFPHRRGACHRVPAQSAAR